MLQVNETSLEGCLELVPRVARDGRGTFVKTFHQDAFADAGLAVRFAEEYYSESRRGVLRGLHFQTPPFHHTKVVYCLHGSVKDVVVDLRVDSPTYGKHAVFDLSADDSRLIYISPGMAHGFCVTSETAILQYKVTTVYAPLHDKGIRWDSVGIDWPTSEPTMSERDMSFPAFAEFESPFFMGKDGARG